MKYLNYIGIVLLLIVFIVLFVFLTNTTTDETKINSNTNHNNTNSLLHNIPMNNDSKKTKRDHDQIIRLKRKNHKNPLAIAYKFDQGKMITIDPPRSTWNIDYQELEKHRLLHVFFNDEPSLQYSVTSILASEGQEAVLECPPLVEVDYRFTNLPENVNIKLVQEWNYTQELLNDSIAPIPYHNNTIFSTTKEETTRTTLMHIGAINSIASASNGAFYPPNREDQIDENTILSEITFKYNSGITLDVTFRENTNGTHEPPQVRSLRTHEIFTSQPHDGENTYRFSGLPFEDYEFVTRAGELYVPLDSYLLFERSKEKTVFKPNTYYHSIRLCRIQLTPVKLILQNDWESSELSFYLHPTHSQGQFDSELNIGLPEDCKYFHANFRAYENNTYTVNMLPGKYECKVLSMKVNDQSEAIKVGYQFPKLEIKIPKQSELYEAYLQFPKMGSIKGQIDTAYFDQYNANVYSSEAKLGEKVYRQVIASAEVENASFYIPHVPPGHYRIKLSAKNITAAVLSDAFHVNLDKTTNVTINTNIGQVNTFSCQIVDFKGRPIRSMPVQLKQETYVSYGKSDENGYLEIPYIKKLATNCQLIILAPNGTIMPQYGGSQVIDLQQDQGKVILFDGLTRFRYLVENTEGVPINSYYLKFELNNSDQLNSSIELFNKESDGWNEIEVLPKGNTKIYGAIGKEPPEQGLKHQPQLIMTHEIKDVGNLVITLSEPNEYRLRFLDERLQPVSNVSVPPMKRAFLTDAILSRDWPGRIKQTAYRTNQDGIINITTSGNMEESIRLYYHESYGLGYIRLTEKSPTELDVYLLKPAELSLKNVLFQSESLFTHYLSIQVPSDKNPLLFHIKLLEAFLPRMLFQPMAWEMLITSTEIDFQSIFDNAMLEERQISSGSVFNVKLIEKKRSSQVKQENANTF